MNGIADKLAAALRNLLEQTYQMKGMFPDEDNTISNAIDDAEHALRSYRQTTHLP
jgi:flagellar capping protein FliD